jgi:hypothetical protein
MCYVLRGFSPSLKNSVICTQKAMLPIQSGVTFQLVIVMAAWHTFLKFELAGSDVAAHC